MLWCVSGLAWATCLVSCTAASCKAVFDLLPMTAPLEQLGGSRHIQLDRSCEVWLHWLSGVHTTTMNNKVPDAARYTCRV